MIFHSPPFFNVFFKEKRLVYNTSVSGGGNDNAELSKEWPLPEHELSNILQKCFEGDPNIKEEFFADSANHMAFEKTIKYIEKNDRINSSAFVDRVRSEAALNPRIIIEIINKVKNKTKWNVEQSETVSEIKKLEQNILETRKIIESLGSNDKEKLANHLEVLEGNIEQLLISFYADMYSMNTEGEVTSYEIQDVVQSSENAPKNTGSEINEEVLQDKIKDYLCKAIDLFPDNAHISMVIIDFNYSNIIKQANGLYDRVDIAAMEQAIKQRLKIPTRRKTDVVMRYNTNSFAIIFPGAPMEKISSERCERFTDIIKSGFIPVIECIDPEMQKDMMHKDEYSEPEKVYINSIKVVSVGSDEQKQEQSIENIAKDMIDEANQKLKEQEYEKVKRSKFKRVVIDLPENVKNKI